MKTINIPCYGLQVICDETGTPSGVTSSLRQYFELGGGEWDAMLESLTNNIEAIVLAHAYSGVDVGSAGYAKGIEMWVETIGRQCFQVPTLNNICN